jgi:hypothetical protein
MKIGWAFLMAQGCGWLGAYTISRSMWIKYHRLFSVLEFDERNSDSIIIDTIKYLKRNNGKINDDAPIGFLSKNERRLVFEMQSDDNEEIEQDKETSEYKK